MHHMHLMRVLCLLSLLLLGATPAAGRGTVEDEASEEQLEGLTDIGDKEGRERLECSACKCVVRDIKEALDKLHTLRHGKQRAYEVEDVMDGICKKIQSGYGILRKNNKPANVFSKNTRISRLQGAWINTFLDGRCGNIVSEAEELLTENYRLPVDRLRELVCLSELRLCTQSVLEDTSEDI